MVGALFQYLKSKGLTISMDTNDDPSDQWQDGLRDVLRFVDVFLPNEREAGRITGTDDPEQAIEKLSEMVPVAVVKMGKKGAMAQKGSQRFFVPGQVVDTVDAIGAGDSFDAGFINQYISGADLPACLAGGNLSGAFSTTRPGGTEAFRDVEYRTRFFRERGSPIESANK
jgi:sugar/nucleoside kinase (ribokinase family)